MGKCWLRRPWARALRETMRLPPAVFGPVDFFALRRLARMRLREIGRLVTEATDFFEAAMTSLLWKRCEREDVFRTRRLTCEAPHPRREFYFCQGEISAEKQAKSAIFIAMAQATAGPRLADGIFGRAAARDAPRAQPTRARCPCYNCRVMDDRLERLA